VTGRQKIAILGGGPAGLSAAYHLTQRPGWRDEYEVTVYSLGWRLGGKAASSRNAEAGHRIEEHGIHLFGNFYTLIFRMMEVCYRELYTRDGKPVETDEPVTTLDQAFIPSDFRHRTSYRDGRWHTQTLWLPHTQARPWKDSVPTPATVIRTFLETIWAVLTGKPAPETSGEPPRRGRLGRLAGRVAEAFKDAIVHAVERRVRRTLAAARGREAGAARTEERPKAGMTTRLARWLMRRGGRIVEHRARLRAAYVLVDFYATVLRGILEDDLLNRDIDAIDGIGYREWLVSHGASELMLNSPLAQVIPNLGFNYPDGDSTQPPAFSAAAYVYFVIRMLLAEGAGLWYFAAGTGESVIAPVYRVLEARGVTFEFFTKVTDVVPSADGSTIEAIECEVQATVKPEHAPYRPLYRVKGMYCWPDRPFYDQLVEGDALREGRIDLESWWSPWRGAGRRTLRKGHEFDHAVLAIPVGAFTYICRRLADQKPAFADTFRHVTAFPTQHFQLWLRKSTQELGWRYKLPPGARVLGAGYNFPTLCYCDFSDLIGWEAWPEAEAPASILYFCGPLQAPTAWPPFSDATFPGLQAKRVEATAIQFLRTIRGLLPDASAHPLQPQGLDFDYLHCHDEATAGTGENRFAQQFVKANIDPNELYVASRPGTVQYRPKAWESGYDNLAFAGDWIYTGMNIGSIDCAVVGGALASHALTGSPSIDEIPGYTFLHRGLTGVGVPLMKR
jgi:uncharacterized protein with NAD-binding domain and iron-sulfur cluster